MRSRKLHSSQIERLTCFPAPWESEAFLGVLTRGYARHGSDVSSFMSALIGKIRCAGTLDPAVPTHSARVSRAMPATHPLADHAHLLRHHSAVPYYLMFAKDERRKTVLGALDDPNTTNLNCVLGFATSRLAPAPHPRSCSSCRQSDIENPKRGAPTYRIEHQLPTNWVCLEHDEVLSDGCAICGREPKRGRLLDLAGCCGDPSHHERLPCTVVEDGERQDLRWIAQQGRQMLARYDDAPGNPLARLRAFALQQHSTPRGLQGASLATAIEARFSPAFLQRLGLAFLSERDRARGWHWQLLVRTTEHRLKEPAQCLVILGALNLDIDAFLSSSPEIKEEDQWPRPPWESELEVALLVSNGALEPVQKLFCISFNRLWRGMIDQGLTVKRRSPLPVSDAVYGDILQRWREGSDQSAMEKQFGVSEHFLKMMTLWEPGLYRAWSAARRESRLNPYRERILAFLQDNPGVGRSRVRAELATEYAAIEDVDRAWIDAHVPRRQGNHRPTEGIERTRRDWERRDQAYAAGIQEWVRRHLDQDERPICLTTQRLLRQFVSPTCYYLNMERLPLTQRVLQGSCEDFETYRWRKTLWAARQCAKGFLPLKADVLRKVAGLERKYVGAHWEPIVEAYVAAGGSTVVRPRIRQPGSSPEAPRRMQPVALPAQDVRRGADRIAGRVPAISDI